MHRVDCQLAAGQPVDPIPADIAGDGLEEMFLLIDTSDPAAEDGSLDDSLRGKTIHLHGTDLDGAEWVLGRRADGVDVSCGHAKADLALRGAVGDLELVLYQRPPVGEVERFGDEAVLDGLHRLFTF